MAALQSRKDIVHFWEALRVAKYTTFKADRSLGKIFLLLIAFLMTELSDSMALVV